MWLNRLCWFVFFSFLIIGACSFCVCLYDFVCLRRCVVVYGFSSVEWLCFLYIYMVNQISCLKMVCICVAFLWCLSEWLCFCLFVLLRVSVRFCFFCCVFLCFFVMCMNAFPFDIYLMWLSRIVFRFCLLC